MTKLSSMLNAWPVLIASTISGAMIFTTASDQVTLPEWLMDIFNAPPQVPAPRAPVPDNRPAVAYAPAPGQDDRTPLAYVSHVFALNDPDLPDKLSGIGPVYWGFGGRGTGALIAPDLVLTTGHLFAKDGKWYGPFGLTDKPPAPPNGRIYLAACGKAYDLKAIHMGAMAPRARLGLDYAIVELAQQACAAAAVLPLSETPDDLVGAEDQIFLNMGAYKFSDITRYATHPLFADKAASNSTYEQQAHLWCALHTDRAVRYRRYSGQFYSGHRNGGLRRCTRRQRRRGQQLPSELRIQQLHPY